MGPVLPELRAVSDAWLAEKNTAEKRFSLGFFDEHYLAHFDIGVVRRDGAIVAFANIWRGGSNRIVGGSHALQRGGAERRDRLSADRMHAVGQGAGLQVVQSRDGAAVGSGRTRLGAAWHKLGRMVQRYGETFYNFEGLRKFKEKFDPVWRPRYLAAPDGLAMAGALLDVTALISGGVRNVLWK